MHLKTERQNWKKKKTGGTETRNKQINNYRDFNTTFSVRELTDNPKNIEELDNPNNLLDLINIYRILHATMEYLDYQVHMEGAPRYIIYHVIKKSLKFKIFES